MGAEPCTAGPDVSCWGSRLGGACDDRDGRPVWELLPSLDVALRARYEFLGGRACSLERRRSPFDGGIYSLQELIDKCRESQWSQQEVEAFFAEDCTPLGTPLPDEGRSQQLVGRPLPLESLAERRRNPEDGGTYTLEELLEACKGFWSQQEVEEFWKAHCTKLPLSANVEDQVEAWLGTPAKDHEAWMDAESPRVVSLGAWCCPTLAAREMGVGGSSLPFDWSRSTLSSVVRALRTDFAGFLEYHEVQAHASRPDGSVARDYRHDLKEEAIVPFKDVYICDGHSFWHDDLWDEREWVKYDRRIRRFLRLAEARLPVLFVRAASHSDELGRAAELLEVLQEKFGESAHLLLLLSYQPSRCTVFITEHPSLLVATLGMHFDRAAEWVGMLPLYVDAMWNAIRYMQSGTLPRSHVVLPSLEVCLANKGVLFQDVDFGDDHTSHWTPFPHSILEQERAMARLGGASIFA